MELDKKYFETGSNPYYLNQNSSAKDFSFNDTTNPQFGLLDTLMKFVVIENNVNVQQLQIEQLFIEK